MNKRNILITTGLILGFFLILFMIGNSGFPTGWVAKDIKKCTELCFEDGDKISQALEDRCEYVCEQIKYYGGESKIAKMIEDYEKSIAFKKDLANGLYDEVIKSCENKRKNAIDVILTFIKNKNSNAKREDAEPYTITLSNYCNSDLKEWVLDGKKGIFGENFEDIAKDYQDKQELLETNCYPVMYEHTLMKWANFEEGSIYRDLTYIEKEARKDCYGRISSSTWNEEVKQSFIKETESYRNKLG